MIRNQSPGITTGLSIAYYIAKAVQEVNPVGITLKNLPSGNSSPDYVMKRTSRINPGFPGHPVP